MKRILNFLLLNVLLISSGWTYDLLDVRSIEINARAGGWGRSRQGEINKLIIRRVGNNFFIANNRNPVNDDMKNSISSLLQLINVPIVDNVNLDNYGVSIDWLYNNGIALINKNYREKWEKNQRDLFMENYCNINLVKRLLQEQYIPSRIHWTDDYPSFELIIRLTDSVIRMRSNSQLPFMLPINITGNTTNGITYNAMLSIALSNILPDNFVLKNRIAGVNLPEYIFDLIYFQIREELSLLDTRNKIGDILSDIENNFHIRSSLIAMIGSIDLDLEEVWESKLIPKNCPSNLVVSLAISYEDDNLGSMREFNKKINSIINSVLDIPWLVNMLENKENEIEIRFVNDKSMSDYAQESFIEELQENKRNSILEEINNNLDKSIFITISNNRNYMRCVVLPDGNTILWHYKGSDILIWDENNFDVWYSYGHKGVGRIILKNGEIK
jgi:hypothetical protein